MSESTTVTVDTEPQRGRQAPERRERVMTEPPVPVAEVGESNEPSPEEALAEARRAIESRDQALAAEQAQRQAAEQRAHAASAQVNQAAAARHQDRAAVAAAGIEAAKADQDRAKQAFLVAREAGDTNAEAKAISDLNGADYRFHAATAELAQYRQQGERPQQQPQQSGVEPEAQAWINRNPRFNSDAGFRDRMLAEHEVIKNKGVIPNSPMYFEMLDQAVQRIDGSSMAQSPKPPASSSGAPPSRGNAVGAVGGNRVETLLGAVSVTQRSDGRVSISIPPALRGDFEDGARIAGMTLGEYAYEQVQIARERQAGGTGGMVSGDGKDFR